MSIPNFAVIVTFSFSDHISVLLFDTPEEAFNFIKKDIMEEYDIDKQNGWDSEYAIFEDERRAVLTAHWRDGDDVTEWSVGTVYEHKED